MCLAPHISAPKAPPPPPLPPPPPPPSNLGIPDQLSPMLGSTQRQDQRRGVSSFRHDLLSIPASGSGLNIPR